MVKATCSNNTGLRITFWTIRSHLWVTVWVIMGPITFSTKAGCTSESTDSFQLAWQQVLAELRFGMLIAYVFEIGRVHRGLQCPTAVARGVAQEAMVRTSCRGGGHW